MENEIEKKEGEENPYILRALESLFQELTLLHRYDDILATARQYSFDLTRLLRDDFKQKIIELHEELSKIPDPIVESFGFPPDDPKLKGLKTLDDLKNIILTEGL